MLNISTLLIAVSALTVLTNIVTEVIKNCFTQGKFSSNFLALMVAEVLTVCSFGAYVAIQKIGSEWYMWVGAVFMGVLVAYAAMFGFDKLKQAIAQIEGTSKDGDKNAE